MKQFLTKTKIWVSLFVLLPFFSFGQEVPIWSQDFSNLENGLPQNWDATDISNNADSIKTLWNSCPDSDACYPFNLVDFNTEIFNSTSEHNGFIFASAENYPIDFIEGVEPFQSHLISPQIPLEDGLTELFLEYQSFLGINEITAHEGTRLSFQFNNNGNWISREIYPQLPFEIDDYQESNNPNLFLNDLSNDLIEGADSIQFRWEWTGKREVVWCLDDIKLYKANPLHHRAVWTGGDFDGSENDWTVAAPLGDTCIWFWHPFGYYGDALLPGSENDTKFITSPTARNGAMVINPDNCYTQNETPDPDITPYPVVSELISPIINLNGTSNGLVLDFYQTIRPFKELPNGYNHPFSYAYSLNNGTSWSENIPLNQFLSLSITHHTHESIPLPNELINQENVRIKFTFSTSFFFWAIDDIRILENPSYDLKISENFFAIPPNYATPISQIDSIPFMVDVENIGSEIQSNVLVEAGIKDAETDEILFLDSVWIDEINSFEIKENLLFEHMFLPSNTVAEYHGFYKVSSDNSDEVPLNNEVNFKFKTTDFLFKKENGTSLGFKPNNAGSYSWGNSFFIKNGEDIYASEVVFALENAEAIANREILIKLFEWPVNELDTLFASPDEIELVGLNTYTFLGIEEEEITIPIVDLATSFNVALKDNTHYFVVLSFEQTNEEDYFVSASQEFDYKASYLASKLIGQERFATMVDEDNEGSFNVIGLGDGFNTVPMVRLGLSNNLTNTDKTKSIVFKTLEISPNPTSNNFSLKLPESAQGNLKIFGLNGEIIHAKKIEKSDGKILKVNLQNVSSGIYFVHFVSHKWHGVEKLIILRE